MKVFHFDTKEDFYQNMGQILKENDTILVKASHFMEFPEIVKILSEEA
jgi:UDP-N-acetylmuramoyl-tripeptide--D-alanyl-D-alanine ligase